MDILRWSVQLREDILMRVSERNRFIRPLVREDETQCPFLAKKADEDIYACRIHRTRPQACAGFPMSRALAKRVGCRGIEPAQDDESSR
jgi:Fe-S-cluster containining protein